MANVRLMPVRPVGSDDREPIRAIARRAHEQSVFAVYPFSDEKFDASFERSQEDRRRHFSVVVPLADGGIGGFAFGSLGDHYISQGARILTVHAFNVAPAIEGTLLAGRVTLTLLRALRHAGEQASIDAVAIHVTSGHRVQAIERVLDRMGATALGRSFLIPTGPNAPRPL